MFLRINLLIIDWSQVQVLPGPHFKTDVLKYWVSTTASLKLFKDPVVDIQKQCFGVQSFRGPHIILSSLLSLVNF